MAFLRAGEKKQLVVRGIFQARNVFWKAANWLLDLLLPPKCLKCSVRVDSAYAICPDCWKDIQFLSDPKCSVCGYPFGVEMGADFSLIGENKCAACQKTDRTYTKAISAVRYDDESRKMIIGFKYNDRLEYAQYFVNLLKIAGKDIFENCDLIIPVPLHHRRLMKRRYNQSAILSRILARQLSMEHQPQLLERTKNTPPQKGNINKRTLNVRGAFAVRAEFKSKVKDRNILLIDDVFTTGATVENCAKALKRAGAGEIYIATVFRVVSPQQSK